MTQSKKELCFVIILLYKDTFKKTPKLTKTFGNICQALPTTICKELYNSLELLLTVFILQGINTILKLFFLLQALIHSNVKDFFKAF